MAAETAESLAVISHRLGSIEASLAAMTAKLDPVVVEREVEKLRLAEVARRQGETEEGLKKTGEKLEKVERKMIAVAGISAGIGGGASGLGALIWKIFHGGI